MALPTEDISTVLSIGCPRHTPKHLEIAGVYAIHNIQNGRAYVGSSRDLRKRWMKHLQLLRRGKSIAALQRDWDTYGPSAFVFVVIQKTQNFWNAARFAEQSWINQLQPIGLYNPTTRASRFKMFVGAVAS